MGPGVVTHCGSRPTTSSTNVAGDDSWLVKRTVTRAGYPGVTSTGSTANAATGRSPSASLLNRYSRRC